MTKKARALAEARPKPLEVPFFRPEQYDPALVDVIGQDELKVKLKSAFSQYTLFLNSPSAGRPVVLVYGATGSGKTFTIEKLADFSGLPVSIVSCASLSPPSFKGTTLQDVLAKHWLDHHTDKGVIVLDELDKWCRGSVLGGEKIDDVWLTNGVRSQQELLRYVQMDKVSFTDLARDIDEMAHVEFQTRNILWIFSGAFVGLPRFVKQRVHANPNESLDELWEHAMPSDFMRYGMVEELTNRIATWAWTRPLDSLQMMNILRTQKVPEWTQRFEAIDCQLTIEDGALGAVARRAHEERIGPRGAMSLLQRAMDDVFVHASSERLSRLTVDANMVETGRVEAIA